MFSKKIMILAGGGGAVVVLFGAIFTYVATSGTGPQKDMKLALSLLDDDRWDVAGRIARDLEADGDIDQETDSAWHFVQGVSTAQSVQDKLESPKNRQALWTSTEHLEKSQELGFPIGYKGVGQFYLGFSYFHTFKWPEAVKVLKESATNLPPRRSEALNMAVTAALRQKPVDVGSARESLAIWKSIPGLFDAEWARIRLCEAELALVDNDTAKCEEELAKIDPKLKEIAEAEVMRGRWRLNAADETEDEARRAELLAQAEGLFRTCAHSSLTPSEQRRQATYLLGRALRAQAKFDEALSTLSGTRQRNPGSSEAVASGLEEAEILLELERPDPCIETVRHVLKDLGNVQLYNQQWVTIDQMRARLLELGRQLRMHGDYERAIDLAGYFPPVLPRADAVRLQAETYYNWAEEFETESVPAADASEHRNELHKKFSMAGQFYEVLSRIEMRSVEYPNIIWQASECYQRAGELESANKLLTEYLKFEERPKQPRGYVALAQNWLNAGEWKKAIVSLQHCIKEYPQHPISYDARLLAARAYNELNELDTATELLKQNLYDGKLEPTSETWRNSLFELGSTVFKQADKLILETELGPQTDWGALSKKLEESHRTFLDAVQQLSEASSRWKDDPRFFETRYLIGKSNRLAAEYPDRLLNSNQVTIDTVRRQLLLQRRELLEGALRDFQSLHTDLNAMQEAGAVSEQLKSILRNSYFGEADALFELGRYDEAILAYRNVGNRFLNQPESLEAFVQIAQCQRKLGQTEQAKRTLVQAEQVLRRIPTEYDTQFPLVTRSSRADWQKLIGWMQTW
jgi:tetratricopeptide (TPR) repeat protein